MKERIVLDFGTEIKNICRGCAEGVKAKCKQTQEDHLQCALQKSELEEFEVEKYPTSWKELKELCKDIKEVTITKEGHINVDFVYFTKDGEIYTYVEGVLTSSIFLPVSKDRTPAQMWNIIKNLIGE